MLRGLLARIAFALAAACALAMSMGVAVPRHQEEPGTPLSHDHVLAAYRFGFLLSPAEPPSMSPEMARFHRTLVQAGVPPDALSRMPGMGHGATPTTLPTLKTARLSPIQDLAIEFALLIVLAPRLARPNRRPLAELPPPRLAADLWRFAPALMPPRLVALPYRIS